MSKTEISQSSIRFPLVIGNAYSDQKLVIRRISWVDGIWVFYEVLSTELKNGIGRRLGHSIDGNPIYKCSTVAFMNWAKQIVPMDVISISSDAVPANLLGKLFRGNDGVVRWLCPSSELPIYLNLYQRNDGVWLHGWRGISKPWVGSEIIGEAPEGAEYHLMGNGKILTKVVHQVKINHEKTIV